jgi:hypothetical protein
MHEVLRALNRLVADGVIVSYAIGGAIGAAFYIEAVQTEDVDAFVVLPLSVSGLLTLEPIYEALTKQGGVVEREFVRFGEWPLQILPDSDALTAEAIRAAMTVEYEGTPTRVFRAEHLCAIALQTGRTKDYLRVQMFLEQSAVDRAVLSGILQRYGLADRMERLK